jgi:hypothetical protein
VTYSALPVRLCEWIFGLGGVTDPTQRSLLSDSPGALPLNRWRFRFLCGFGLNGVNNVRRLVW